MSGDSENSTLFGHEERESALPHRAAKPDHRLASPHSRAVLSKLQADSTSSPSGPSPASSSEVTITVHWVCETCWASGEVDAEFQCHNLAELTIDELAATMLDAIRAVPHPHPVRPAMPAPS